MDGGRAEVLPMVRPIRRSHILRVVWVDGAETHPIPETLLENYEAYWADPSSECRFIRHLVWIWACHLRCRQYSGYDKVSVVIVFIYL